MKFEEHCVSGARQFLHTALVIDDRAELGQQTEYSIREAHQGTNQRFRKTHLSSNNEASLLVSTPTESSAFEIDSESVNNFHRAAKAPKTENSTALDSTLSIPATNNNDAGSLNAKELTDAFLALDMICGVYKPIDGENSSTLAIKAAQRADIVVVDWYLGQRNSLKAKEIVTGILKSDVDQFGRLRLISIYTSEPDRADIARELYESIEKHPSLKGKFTFSDKAALLTKNDTRICIFNKEGTLTKAGDVQLKESELPLELVSEFAKLSGGLLANFAVSSIASVRRGAHHLLSRFHTNLDGAYVSHRIMQKNPSDSEEMAMERISSEIANLIENSDIASRALSPEVIDSWIDSFPETHKFKSGKSQIPRDTMKEYVRGGELRLKEKDGQLRNHDLSPALNGEYISQTSILQTFYETEKSALAAARDFSRLTSFKREARQVRLDAYKPRLTLGSILRVRKDIGNSNYSDVAGDFLLCVQPRCDSVRLTESRAFPFQQGKHDIEKFNLIVDDGTNNGYIHLDVRPLATVMLKFLPAVGDSMIFATRDLEGFFFTDISGRRFDWIGDLDDLKAQRFASEVGAGIHRVGVDEFEWLRLGALGKIKIENGAVAAPSASPARGPSQTAAIKPIAPTAI